MFDERHVESNLEQSTLLLTLLRISAIFLLFRFIFELYRFSVWSKLGKGVPLTDRLVNLVELIELITLIAQGVLLIACLVAFIFWLNRAYINLQGLQISPLKMEPNWSILGWFIPIANLRIPFLLISEVMQGYEKFLMDRDYIRRDPRRHSIKGWWWFTLIIGALLLLLGFQLTMSGLFFRVVSLLFLMISSFLGISMISNIRMMERGIMDQKDVKVRINAQDDLLDN